MLGHIEVQHLAASMFQYEEHEQHLHGDRRHDEEIHGSYVTDVVVEKGLPGLSERATEGPENSGDGAL